MRILTFYGSYGYKPNETFSGSVCFCHVEKNETPEKIAKIAAKLILLSQGSKVILVPFAHLYEDVAESPVARTIFEQLHDKIGSLGHDVMCAPFGITKELHFDVPADDSAIKFLNF